MTFSDEPLDRLAPALPWEPDWSDVLDRAGDRTSRLTKRRLVVVLALLAAVLVPLAALAAESDWWFFRSAGAPTPANAPLVIKEDQWGGRPWQLIAYRSVTDGLCVSITPKGSKTSGAGSAMSCGPMVGVARTSGTKASPDMTITYLSGSGGELPAYVVGPVVDRASDVEIHFETGQTLRVPTFGAPAELGHVRFYATQLPPGVPPLGPPTNGRRPFIQRLAGLDADGAVVACLVPSTAVDGISSLSDCS